MLRASGTEPLIRVMVEGHEAARWSRRRARAGRRGRGGALPRPAQSSSAAPLRDLQLRGSARLIFARLSRHRACEAPIGGDICVVPIVAGNWKMHGSRADNEAADRGDPGGARSRRAIDVRGLSAVRLSGGCGRGCCAARRSSSGRRMCAPRPRVPSPARSSAAMLKDVGCHYVIVGHSERRRLYGEDDALVARKFAAAHRGRTDADPVRRRDSWPSARRTAREEVVARQLEAVVALTGIGSFAQCGGGLRAGLGDRHRPHRLARSRRRRCMPSSAADWRRGMLKSRPICGSCTAAASRRAMRASCSAMADVDGGLIGGASLKAEEFLSICRPRPSRLRAD